MDEKTKTRPCPRCKGPTTVVRVNRSVGVIVCAPCKDEYERRVATGGVKR